LGCDAYVDGKIKTNEEAKKKKIIELAKVLSSSSQSGV
jgi:hypothetical protein